MARRLVAELLGGELSLLQFGVGRHAAVAIAVRELEHRIVERVEAGESDELELVAHGPDLALEPGDGRLVELGLPVEGGRAVIGHHLAGEALLDRLGESLRVVEIGVRGLPPDEIGLVGIGEAARDAVIDAGSVLQTIEALRRAALIEIDEFMVALVNVGGDEFCRLRVRARDEKGRHAADVSREAGGVEIAFMRLGRNEHLSAEMAALLFGRKLVLEMHARRSGLDIGLHDLETVQGTAETRFRIGDDGEEIVARYSALGIFDLVGAAEGVVDATRKLGA